MLAHWHAQVWNSSEFARSFGVADTTVRRYLDILTGALVVRQLQPWHANIAKRQVKAPKVYLRDTGVLHALLGIDGMRSLNTHPKSGHRGKDSCSRRSSTASVWKTSGFTSGRLTRARSSI